MKNLKLATLIVLTILATHLFGQDDSEMTFDASRGVSKTISSSGEKCMNDITTDPKQERFVIAPKKVDATFTGFMVKVVVSHQCELPLTDKLFAEYGKIKVDKTENGDFVYLVGEFKKDHLAYEYLVKVISPRYPFAGVVEYKDGKIVVPVVQ
jgi:uncharacterized protein (DUF2249 family)